MFRGSIVALVTPMTATGQIDEVLLKRLVDWHIEQGTHAIVAMGTTGESATLSEEEHLRVVQLVLMHANERVPVIAGTGSASTSKAIAMTKAVEALGVQATLCVTPYYVRPTQEGMRQHFLAIADAAQKPILLYNVPSRTGTDLLPPTVAKLALHPHIVGIKEATGKLERVNQLREASHEDFVLLSGDDATCCDFMLQGGQGVISVTANVAPHKMAMMAEAALDGDSLLAKELDADLQGLHIDLFVEPNPTPAKWAVHQLLGGTEYLRLPLLPLSEPNQPVVRAAMKRAGVLS